MKKSFFSLAILALVIGFSSCSSSSSFEKDVKKMAGYRCKKQQLMAKDQSDEKVQKELADVDKEMDEYKNKMEAKYKDKENDKDMNEKADKIMDAEMAKCK